MDILDVKDLKCGYDTREVIKGVSFTVQEKCLLGIIGPNGAGKTTLFRAITRILRPRGGRILYEGKDIENISTRDFARKVAVIPQILEIPFSFSVEEFVSMGRFPHVDRFEAFREKDRETIEQALELTDTQSLRKRKINELSGGERQRAILAQGFAQEPRLLLLDEPTSYLDISHRIDVFRIITRLAKEKNITVMCVLHDVNLASKYCERLILLKDGEIAYEGRPEEVVRKDYIDNVYSTDVNIYKGELSKKPQILY